MSTVENNVVDAVDSAILAADQANKVARETVQTELASVRSQIETLESETRSQIKTLQARATDLEKRLAAMGVSTRRRGGGRPKGSKNRSASGRTPKARNDMALEGYVLQAVNQASAEIDIDGVISAVQDAGYTTNSGPDSFRSSVTQKLCSLANDGYIARTGSQKSGTYVSTNEGVAHFDETYGD